MCSIKKAFSADMLHIYRGTPIQKCDFSRVELTLRHGFSPVNWLNVEHLLEKHLWVTAFVYMEVNTRDTSRH